MDTTDDQRSLPVIVTAHSPAGSPTVSRLGSPPRLLATDRQQYTPYLSALSDCQGAASQTINTTTTTTTTVNSAQHRPESRVAPLLFANSKLSPSPSSAAAAAAAIPAGLVFQYHGEVPRSRGSRRVPPLFNTKNSFSSSISSSKLKVNLGASGTLPGAGPGAMGGGSGGTSPEVASQSGGSAAAAATAAAAAGGGGTSPRGNRRDATKDALFVPINPEQAAASGMIRAAFLQEGVQQWLPSLPRTPRPRAKRLQSMAQVVAVTPKPKRSRVPGAAPEPSWSCTYTVGVEDALKRGFAHGLKIGYDPLTPQVQRFTAAHQGGDTVLHAPQGHLTAVTTGAAGGGSSGMDM